MKSSLPGVSVIAPANTGSDALTEQGKANLAAFTLHKLIIALEIDIKELFEI